MKHSWIIVVWVLFLIACSGRRPEAALPSPSATDDQVSTNDTTFQYPSHFPRPIYSFDNNPFNSKKVLLGRMLFYDPILSRDSTISCASCHQPFAAFSHLKHDVSHGVNSRLGFRNTPGLFNLAWSPTFMWDGAVPNIEVLPLSPIANHVEMDETLPNVLKKLNQHPVYRSKFKEAFSIDSIQSVHMLKAMAQFLVSIVSSNSKYDRYKQGKESLSAAELKGMALVQQKCTPCHGGEMFTDYQYRNMGIDTTLGISFDLGREAFTGAATDRRKFKTPSLRNFTITYPYLHDGRCNGFDRTMDFHDKLIQDNPNLDPLFKSNSQIGIKLTLEERSAIFKFLTTLTDNTLSTNPAYSSPFGIYVPSDRHKD